MTDSPGYNIVDEHIVSLNANFLIFIDEFHDFVGQKDLLYDNLPHEL